MAESGSPVAARPIAATGVALVVAALPAFLVGGLAVQIRRDLGFGEAALGGAVTGGFLVSAAIAPVIGRVTDRLGARRSLLVGTTLSLAALAGIAAFATQWLHLALLLGVAGLGMAFTDPGLAILVSRSVPHRRHGLAFGIKEAAIPGATLVAGLAVPTIAVTFGWRWAFLVGLVPLVALLWLMADRRIGVPPPFGGAASASISSMPDAGPVTPADPATPEGPGRPADPVPHADPLPHATPSPHVEAAADGTPPGPPRVALLLIAAATALGSGAASGISVFLTESGVAMGLGESAAGLLLATGSIAGIATRIGTGLRADRDRGPQLALMTTMLALGAATMAVGAVGTTPTLVLGTIGAFSAGWGWTGLMFLSLVRLSPASPGAAAGVGLGGLAVGNGLGPLAFGLAAGSTSYTAAWLGAAALAAIAALLVHAARRVLDHHDPVPATAR